MARSEFADGSARLGFVVSAERDNHHLGAEPPSRDAPRRAGLSCLRNDSVPSSRHRHHLPLFFADGLFADREWLRWCPFSDVQADRLRTVSNALSGDPRRAFSTRSSERAN